MLQYYLTDCTSQCCSIIWRTVPLNVAVLYCLYVRKEELWQNERNSTLCEPQLAAEKLNSAHRLSRETSLISPRDLFTNGSVESVMYKLDTWRSRGLPTRYTCDIPQHSYTSRLYSYTKPRFSVIYRYTAICFYFVFYAQWSTVSATSWITSQKVTMWLTHKTVYKFLVFCNIHLQVPYTI